MSDRPHETSHDEPAGQAPRSPVALGPISAADRPETDARFMELALEMAERGRDRGEVPVGAVLVRHGRVVAASGNEVEARRSALAHAELIVLEEAARQLGRHEFDGTTLYVTLEPCVMCAGALVASRVESLVFGTRDVRFGGCRSVYRITADFRLNHRLKVHEGMLAEQAAALLHDFFRHRRLQNRDPSG